MRFKQATTWISALALTSGLLAQTPAQAATLLVSEGFGGANGTNLAGTSADTYHADLLTAGGTGNWAGSANVKADGAAYGNNVKVIYLDLGSYINDAKGDADAIFTLSALLGPNGSERGSSLNWLSFSTSSSPAAGNNTTSIASIGIDAQGDTIASSFGPGMASITEAATTVGDHVVSIELDFTAANYNGVTSFGKITLSDSVAGSLGSTTLTSDQSFSSIALYVAAGKNQGSRTDSRYDNLTLTQAPEPGSLALMAIGGLLIVRRRRG